MIHKNSSAILITGGSGYVGSLLAAKLLLEEPSEIVLPVRSCHTPESILERIAGEIRALGQQPTDELLSRLIVLELPPTNQIGCLQEVLRDLRVGEIVHCAGSADYFNPTKLQSGNIELTQAFVDLSKKLQVSRFILISTAFSSGYCDGLIRESLHGSTSRDPTPYTHSKRTAEWIVVESGLPYLILRPSIIIGDSRDGRYSGPRFGLYQLWNAAERFMCIDYLQRVHSIAPRYPMHLIHQDALQEGFVAAYRHLEPGAVVHLVSSEHSLPTVRDVYDLWMEHCLRPHEVFYYDNVTNVPMDKISSQEKYFIEFANVNLQISAHPWHFERKILDRFCAGGMRYPDATAATVAICQRLFIQESQHVQRFIQQFARARSESSVRRYEMTPINEPTGPVLGSDAFNGLACRNSSTEQFPDVV